MSRSQNASDIATPNDAHRWCASPLEAFEVSDDKDADDEEVEVKRLEAL